MEQLSPRQEIWRGLLFGQRSMMLRLTQTLKGEHDLTVPQFEALLTLREHGSALSMTELAASLLYSSGSASHLVSRLEERGLVTRRPGDEDARVVMVELTAAGVRVIEAALAVHQAQLDAEFGVIVADDEVDVLLGFVRRLAAAEGVRTQPPVLPPAR